MDFVGGKIRCYCGPSELGAPDDLERVIVDFIGRATKTVDVAVQELDSVPIAEALIARRLAGASVRVILNHSYLQTRGSTGPIPSRPGPSPPPDGRRRQAAGPLLRHFRPRSPRLRPISATGTQKRRASAASHQPARARSSSSSIRAKRAKSAARSSS